MTCDVVILAAGYGKRMATSLPKVLHPLGGLPMLGHVLRQAKTLNPRRMIVVTAPTQTAVQDFLQAQHPDVLIAHQETPLGTAHAVSCALPLLSGGSPDATVLVLFGDTPLIQETTLHALVVSPQPMAIITMRPDHAGAYGRVVLDDNGHVQAIVEAADATDQQRSIDLCNAGLMRIQHQHLSTLLPLVQPSPRTNEYYLTALVTLAQHHGIRCGHVEGDAHTLQGINTRVELAQAERTFQQRWRTAAMLHGATLIDPESVHLSFDTRLGRDVTVFPHVVFGPGVTVDDGATIRSFCVLNACSIGKGVSVGPCAHIRPGAQLADHARVGNFVEIKNSILSSKSRVDHLSYIGDAHIGDGAQIGAGTITCNYNGATKSPTHIGARTFVGSHSTLVAPLTIDDDAFIAAGSVITQNVSVQDLAIARTRQVNYPGGAAKLKQKLSQSKSATNTQKTSPHSSKK